MVPLRAQQFYDASVFAAEDLGYSAMAKAFAAEDVRAAQASDYPSIEALTRSHLGKLEMREGEFDEADKELRHAHRLLSMLPASLATQAYISDAEIDLAEIEIQRHQLREARDRLEKLKPSLAAISSFPIPLRFYCAYAKVLEDQGQMELAEAAFEEAKGIAAQNLGSLSDSASRYAWMQETAALFRDFVQFEFLKGDAENALAIWEWYRAAALERSAVPLAPIVRLHRLLPSLKGQTVISYVLLPQGLAIWAFDERGIYPRFIPLDGVGLVSRVRRFLEVCGNSESSIQIVEREAKFLYGTFLAPVESRLVPARLSGD